MRSHLNRALLLPLLAIWALACAHFTPTNLGLGFSGQPTGGGLSITTSVLSTCTVGTQCVQPLAITGGTPPYTCNQVSAAPNYLLWVSVTPGCSVTGTPQMAETESVMEQVTDSTGASSQKTFSLTSQATGSLAFVSPTSTTGSQNGEVAYEVLVQGGQPPYIFSSTNQAQPCSVTWVGFVECETGTTNYSMNVTVTDSFGTSASETFAVNTDATLRMGAIDSADGIIHMPPAVAGQKYTAKFHAYGGSGTGYGFTATAGLPAWASPVSTISQGGVNVGVLTGIPTRSGAFQATIQVTDSASHTASANAVAQVLNNQTVSRPAYNSSSANGYFVLNGQLYDPNGAVFRMRGQNWLHTDNGSYATFGDSAANTVRIWDACDNTTRWTAHASTYVADKVFMVFDEGGVPGSCSTDGTQGNTSTTDLALVLAQWVANLSTLNTYVSESAIDVANEWGPSNSINWLYAYEYVTGTAASTSGSVITLSTVSATNPFANAPFGYIAGSCGATAVVFNVTATGGLSGAWTVTTDKTLGTHSTGCTAYGGADGVLRGAGWTGPIIADSGGSGQNLADIFSYAQTRQQADPEQNTIVAYHSYNSSNNLFGVIQSVTAGATTTVTLNSNLPYHPFNVGNSVNGAYSGIDRYYIVGAQGGSWTALNGTQASPTNTYVTGSQWQLHLNLNSTAFTGTYVPGSAQIVTAGVDASSNNSNYSFIAGQLAALRANNVMVLMGEFGPGARTGDPSHICCDGDATPDQIGQIISADEAYAIPYLEWAIDDNNLAGSATSWSALPIGTVCTGTTCWFGSTLLGPGTFHVPADLTAPGQDFLLNPRYGVNALASPAAAFN